MQPNVTLKALVQAKIKKSEKDVREPLKLTVKETSTKLVDIRKNCLLSLICHQ